MNPQTTAANAYAARIDTRKVLLAGLAAIFLVSCGGGGDDSDSSCGAPPQITSTPPTVATVGSEYRYEPGTEYSCRMPFWPFWNATCHGGFEIVHLPEEASPVFGITWTPGANRSNTEVQFSIATPRDLCGRQVTQSWTVSVHAAPSIAVTSTIPANAATGTALDSLITIEFSEILDGSTITPATVMLQDNFGNRVPAAVRSSGRIATLDPTAQLTPSTTYRATVTAGVRGLSGNALATSHSWAFSTGPN